mgnify:CR=1 FL=1
MRNSFIYKAAFAVMFVPSVTLSAQTIRLNAEGGSVPQNDDVSVNKTVKNNFDGSYTLELSTYAKGKIEVVTGDPMPVPVDATLVLDLSGSMSDAIGSSPTYQDTGVKWDGAIETLSAGVYYVYNADRSARIKFVISPVSGQMGTQNVVRGTVTGANGVKYVIERTQSNGTYTTTKNEIANSGLVTTSNTNTRKNLQRLVSGSVGTRLDALKESVAAFAQNMLDQTNEWAQKGYSVEHRIAVVTFRGNSRNTEKLFDLTRVTASQLSQTNTDGIYRKVYGLSAGGATWANDGLDLVSGIYSGQREYVTYTNKQDPTKKDTVDVKRVVLFFTDGQPGTSSNSASNPDNDTIWTNETNRSGNEVAYKSINIAKDIKDSTKVNADIYTISVISNMSKTSKAYKYLAMISSAYPEISCSGNYANWTSSYPSSPNTTEENKFNFQADNSEDLVAIFKSISKNTTSDSIPATMGSTTKLVDVVSEHFVIPSGVSENNISVFTQDFDGKDSAGEYKFINEQPAPEATISLTTDSEGHNVVTVSNYDFTEHWVGYEADQTTMHPCGQSLIIRIKIEPNPESDGGIVETNVQDGSGVYVVGEDGSETKLATYVTPQSVYADQLITLTKKMQPFETAIIIVKSEQDPTKVWRIMLSADENGDAIAYLKVPVQYNSGTPENPTPSFCTYTMYEEKDWSWSYDVNDSQKLTNKALYDSSANPLDTVFDFTNDPNQKATILHGADSNINVFEYNGPSISSGSNTSTSSVRNR